MVGHDGRAQHPRCARGQHERAQKEENTGMDAAVPGGRSRNGATPAFVVVHEEGVVVAVDHQQVVVVVLRIVLVVEGVLRVMLVVVLVVGLTV